MNLQTRCSWARLGALLLFCLFFVPKAHAQSFGDLPPMQWYSANDPVSLGQGVEISTAGIGTRNSYITIDDSLIDKQQPITRFESYDFARSEEIVKNLKINAWATVKTLTFRGSLDFNYNKFTSSNIDERKWEVDAVRLQTWSLKKLGDIPAPTGAAAATFRSRFGNYYAAAVTYRRRLRVRFTSQVSKQVSEQDIRLVIALSTKVFSASADVSDLQYSLTKLGSVSVEIEIDGIPGSEVLAVGGIGDLETLRNRVSDLLSHFDEVAPGERPGVIDAVKLRDYSTLFAITFDPFKTPKEDSLALSIADYIRLETLRDRLQTLRTRNYNVRLKNYLLSKTQEVETKRQVLVKYMQRLIQNQDEREIPRPTTDVAFEDPEVIRWRLVRWYLTPGNATLATEFEVSGEYDVQIKCTNAYLPQGGYPDPASKKIDPITGITKWRYTLQANYRDAGGLGDVKPDMEFILKTQEGAQYLLATDPTKVRQLRIILPFAFYG